MLSAWDVEAGELVWIGHGDADRLRAACRDGRLVCPIPNCSRPALTTRRAYTNRWGTLVVDGFRHLVAPDVDDRVHSPESARHQAGKAAVKAWLRSQGFTSVRAERTVRIDPGGQRPGRGRRRRPDVSGVHRSGRRVAVEVQVTPLGEPAWRARTADLRAGGWAPLWLWAWPVGSLSYADTTALRAAADDGFDVWFLDVAPDGARLGWAHQAATIGGEEFKVPPSRYDQPVHIDWTSLDMSVIAPDGTLRPRTSEDDERRLVAAHARQEEHDRQQESDRRRRDAEAAARRAQAASARRAAAQAQESLRRRQAEQQARRHDGSHLGPLPAQVRDVCHRSSPADHLIWLPPYSWKAGVADRLLNRSDLPGEWTLSAITRWVEASYPCTAGTAGPAVRHLLLALSAVDGVHFDGRVARVGTTMTAGDQDPVG